MSGRASKFGDFVTGILVGGAVGYVAALLSAPRSGDETRQMLNERSRDVRDRAMETVQTTVGKTEKLVSGSRERLGTTLDDTRNRMEGTVSDLKDRSGSVVTGVRSQVSDSLYKAAEQVDPNMSTKNEEQIDPQI